MDYTEWLNRITKARFTSYANIILGVIAILHVPLSGFIKRYGNVPITNLGIFDLLQILFFISFFTFLGVSNFYSAFKIANYAGIFGTGTKLRDIDNKKGITIAVSTLISLVISSIFF